MMHVTWMIVLPMNIPSGLTYFTLQFRECHATLLTFDLPFLRKPLVLPSTLRLPLNPRQFMKIPKITNFAAPLGRMPAAVRIDGARMVPIRNVKKESNATPIPCATYWTSRCHLLFILRFLPQISEILPVLHPKPPFPTITPLTPAFVDLDTWKPGRLVRKYGDVG